MEPNRVFELIQPQLFISPRQGLRSKGVHFPFAKGPSVSSRRRQGVTLIELIVMISIIAVTTFLLLPLLNQNRGTVAASNVRTT